MSEQRYDHVWVDIPKPPEESGEEGEWRNVATFHTVSEAVAFIREKFGPCDDDGRISLVTRGTPVDDAQVADVES